MKTFRPGVFRLVDGLVIVDLRQTEPSVLERHMGKEGFANFRRFHGLD